MGFAMIGNFREFEAGPDPLGKTWRVEFIWLQTGVAIRHSDSVDVKFFISDGERKLERVVALPHPELLRLSKSRECPLTDAWCLKLAARHIARMIATGEDMEKALVTVPARELERHAAELDALFASNALS